MVDMQFATGKEILVIDRDEVIKTKMCAHPYSLSLPINLQIHSTDRTLINLPSLVIEAKADDLASCLAGALYV